MKSSFYDLKRVVNFSLVNQQLLIKKWLWENFRSCQPFVWLILQIVFKLNSCIISWHLLFSRTAENWHNFDLLMLLLLDKNIEQIFLIATLILWLVLIPVCSIHQVSIIRMSEGGWKYLVHCCHYFCHTYFI